MCIVIQSFYEGQNFITAVKLRAINYGTLLLGIFTSLEQFFLKESGSVVLERQTPNREVLGSIPTGVTVLCH